MKTTQARITDLLSIVRGEFSEMPGLQLTKPQIQRLWGIESATCDALVDELVNEIICAVIVLKQHLRRYIADNGLVDTAFPRVESDYGAALAPAQPPGAQRVSRPVLR